MLINIIFIITAILGLVVTYLIGFQYKSNRAINIFLIILFLTASVRFLAHGIVGLTSNFYLKNQINKIDFLIIIYWPCIYLYFKNLINSPEKFKSKILLHFILPSILFFFFCIKFIFLDKIIMFLTKIYFIYFIISALFYCYLSYETLKKKVWRRKSDIYAIDNQNKSISIWTKYIFFIFSLMLIRFLIDLMFNKQNDWFRNQNHFLWIGAIIWIFLFIKILTSPEILYGYDVLNKKINDFKKNNIILENIWKTNANKSILNTQDLKLKDKVKPNINMYIIEIEKLSFNSDLFLNSTFTIQDLANKLNLPNSHIIYLFKYHSKFNFLDYKKLIQIQKAISLLKANYLKTNTINSLATEVGFSSYSPFFKSFKSITGQSPQDYYKKLT